MDKAIFKTAKEMLDKYLEMGNRRKTPERYMMLETIYSINGMFNLDDLQKQLEKKKIYLSRATVYNTIKLFVQLRLLNRYRQEGETKYEASLLCRNRCTQICTTCGKAMEIKIRSMPALRNNIPLKRFRGESYTIAVYGICSSCVAKQTRLLKQQEKEKKKKQKIAELQRFMAKTEATQSEDEATQKTKNQRPTTKNQKPKTNNQQPTTNNQRPTTNNQRPKTNKK